VQNVYNTASIEAKTSYAGGIVGLMGYYIYTTTDNTLATVSNAYNKGTVKAPNWASGIVNNANYSNYYYGSRYWGQTYNSYNIGLVESAGSNKYGIAIANMSNSYYDVNKMSSYEVASSLKPRVTSGWVESDTLLYGDATSLKWDDAIWEFKSKTESNSYYPQLKVFSESSNEDIQAASLASSRS